MVPGVGMEWGEGTPLIIALYPINQEIKLHSLQDNLFFVFILKFIT